MSLSGKTILLGVTGGIAAYKTPDLVRALTRAGARVQVILTRAAEEFVTPLTLQTLSGHPVARSLFDLTEESEIGHIRLAETADALLIAPATANVIAKLAAGMADDLLTTVALATRAPILICPVDERPHVRAPDGARQPGAAPGRRPDDSRARLGISRLRLHRIRPTARSRRHRRGSRGSRQREGSAGRPRRRERRTDMGSARSHSSSRESIVRQDGIRDGPDRSPPRRAGHAGQRSDGPHAAPRRRVRSGGQRPRDGTGDRTPAPHGRRRRHGGRGRRFSAERSRPATRSSAGVPISSFASFRIPTSSGSSGR